MKSRHITITSVKHHKDYQLEIELSTGQRKIIDLGNFIKKHPMCLVEEYRDLELFKTVYLDEVMGGPSWPGNFFDISPESVIKGEFDVGQLFWTQEELKKYVKLVEELNKISIRQAEIKRKSQSKT